MTTGRLTQLDGLRGFASAVVLVCHGLAFLPGIGDIFLDRSTPLNHAEAWLVFSPLHVLWNGTAAVYVFFVLSGFVLVLPYVGGGSNQRWTSYYPRRLLRLYVPVWGSIALALVLALAVPRSQLDGSSAWSRQYLEPVDPGNIFRGLTIVFGGTELNPPLWSLLWEVGFSLLLPLYILVAVRGRLSYLSRMLLCLGFIAIGSLTGIQALIYLPVFALGALLGARWKSGPGRSVPTAAAALILLASLVLLNSEWYGYDELPAHEVAVAVGALAIVWLFTVSPRAAIVGNSPFAQFLGRVSFSLYLVHMPVLFALITVTIGHVGILAAVMIGMLGSIIVAVAFYWAVEKPAHRMSISVGRYMDRILPRQSQ